MKERKLIERLYKDLINKLSYRQYRLMEQQSNYSLSYKEKFKAVMIISTDKKLVHICRCALEIIYRIEGTKRR